MLYKTQDGKGFGMKKSGEPKDKQNKQLNKTAPATKNKVEGLDENNTDSLSQSAQSIPGPHLPP